MASLRKSVGLARAESSISSNKVASSVSTFIFHNTSNNDTKSDLKTQKEHCSTEISLDTLSISSVSSIIRNCFEEGKVSSEDRNSLEALTDILEFCENDDMDSENQNKIIRLKSALIILLAVPTIAIWSTSNRNDQNQYSSAINQFMSLWIPRFSYFSVVCLQECQVLLREEEICRSGLIDVLVRSLRVSDEYSKQYCNVLFADGDVLQQTASVSVLESFLRCIQSILIQSKSAYVVSFLCHSHKLSMLENIICNHVGVISTLIANNDSHMIKEIEILFQITSHAVSIVVNVFMTEKDDSEMSNDFETSRIPHYLCILVEIIANEYNHIAPDKVVVVLMSIFRFFDRWCIYPTSQLSKQDSITLAR